MFDGVAHAGPWARRRRRAEPALTDRLLRVRHAAPDADPEFGGAAQVAARRMDDGCVVNFYSHARIVMCKAGL
jgi:hypothetical protein